MPKNHKKFAKTLHKSKIAWYNVFIMVENLVFSAYYITEQGFSQRKRR